MSFCLPQKHASKIIEALKDDTITPERLTSMTSKERRELFTDIIGEENARAVNAGFEKTLLLKNQRAGMVTWVKGLTGIKEPARRDIVSRIQRLDRVLDADDMDDFLEDLASAKLGTDITFKEAETITKMSKRLAELEEGLLESPVNSQQRLDYSSTKVALKNYVDELKLSNNKTTLSNLTERMKTNPGRLLKDAAVEIAGASKAVVASIDNSLWFRQGLKALFTNPRIWSKNFAKSWGDIARQLSRKPDDTRIIDGTLASIWSRDNAIKNIYQKAKLDVGITEEAYPSSLPTKIPGLGRFFKASETAYTAGSYRLRADLFDNFYKKLSDSGVDMTDRKTLEDLGTMVNSMTGRGNLGKLEAVAKEANVFLFSPRHLKSQFDFITAHRFQYGGMTPEVRRIAYGNLLKTSTGVASVLGAAYALDPESVELDPRSSDFGKIRVGNTRFDVTAGISSMITVLSRMATQSTKSSRTGRVRELNTGEFGSQTVKGVFGQFLENKLSPAAQAVDDYYFEGSDFSGEKPTALGTIENMVTPIVIQNVDELLSEPGAANVWIASILDAIGVGTNTY